MIELFGEFLFQPAVLIIATLVALFAVGGIMLKNGNKKGWIAIVAGIVLLGFVIWYMSNSN